MAPSTKAPNNLEIQTVNGAFGGSFTSRLNMNLREDKHWAYGAGSFSQDAIGQRPLHHVCAGADRQDRRFDRRNAQGSHGRDRPKPLTHEEIDKIKVSDVRALPGQLRDDRRRARRDQCAS